MIVRVAVGPHPPLPVPELAAGAAAETAPLRNACPAAVAVVDPAAVKCGWGSFASYRSDVQVDLDPEVCYSLGNQA